MNEMFALPQINTSAQVACKQTYKYRLKHTRAYQAKFFTLLAAILIGYFASAQFSATWALTSNKIPVTTGNDSLLVTAGNMIPGSNFANPGSHNIDGYRAKQSSGNWPTTATNGNNIDFPLSPVGLNMAISGLTMTVRTSGSSGSMVLALAYQEDGTGAWTSFGGTQTVGSGAITNVNFGTLMAVFEAGHTYVIRLYIYAASTGTSASRNVDIKNVVFSGFPGMIVPVAFEYFKAIQRNNQNILDGKISNLTTELRISIQRSSDKITFQDLSSVNTAHSGNSIPFTFTDLHPNNGANFYRLKLTASSGHIYYSSILSLTNRENTSAFVGIYPLTIKSSASISFIAEKNQEIQTIISDANGKCIKKTTYSLIKGNNLFSLNYIPVCAGIYYLTVFMDGNIKTIPFVKQ